MFAAVLTMIIAFIPLAFIPGTMGQIVGVLPVVVVATMIVSTIESLFLLPTHLNHLPDPNLPEKPRPRWQQRLIAFHESFAKGLEWFAQHMYQPAVRTAIRYRYVTLCCGISVLLMAGGLVAGGMVRVQGGGGITARSQPAAEYDESLTKIARIRPADYARRERLVDEGGLSVDVTISPEALVTEYVQQLINNPGALQVLDFAEGRVRLVGVHELREDRQEEQRGLGVERVHQHALAERGLDCLKLDEITFNEVKDQAVLWMAASDADTGELLAREPEAILALWNEEYGQWSLYQKDDDVFLDKLLESDFRDSEIYARFTEYDTKASITGTIYGGFKLPWRGGLTKRLTWSVGHTSCANAYCL